MAYVFGLQTIQLIDITKIFQLKGTKPKNNDQMNFMNVVIWRKKYIYYTHIISGGEWRASRVETDTPRYEDKSLEILKKLMPWRMQTDRWEM